MRVRAAALARDRVDRLDELGAHLEQAGVRERHDVALAGEDHDLLSVADVDPGALELEEDGSLGDVDSERHTTDALLVERRADLLGRPPLQPDDRRDRALEPCVAADRIRLVVELWQLESMRFGSRTEVPDPRGAARPRHQRVSLALVEPPVADVRAGRVPDVARLEEQDRTQIRYLQLLANPAEPIVAEAVEVDAVLPVDSVDARSSRCRDREFFCHAIIT